MFFKNITQANVLVLGITLEPSEMLPVSEFGNSDKIIQYYDEIIELINSNNITLCYIDGVAETNTAKISRMLSGNITNVTIDYEASNKENNYYFLKDKFDLKKDETIEKLFRGRVKYLKITPDKSTINIKIITGDGLTLPADNIIKREELEFNFDGDIKDLILSITAEGRTEVEIFMEGFNNDMEPKDLQTFIDTWYKNEETWNNQNAVILMVKDNAWDVDSPSLIQDPTGNTLVIPDRQFHRSGYYYRVYKIANNEYFVEYLENNRWSIWNPNRYAVRVKNIKYIQFTDKTIDVTTSSDIIPYEDYQFDKSNH